MKHSNTGNPEPFLRDGGTIGAFVVKVRNKHSGCWRTQSRWPTLEAAEREAARVFAGCPKAIFKGRKKLHNFTTADGLRVLAGSRGCNVCGGHLRSGRCTNGRCLDCHREMCTPGGSTSPGHGRGWPTTAERAAASAVALSVVSRIGEVTEPMRSLLVELINSVASHSSGHEEKLRQLVKDYEEFARRRLN